MQTSSKNQNVTELVLNDELCHLLAERNAEKVENLINNNRNILHPVGLTILVHVQNKVNPFTLLKRAYMFELS